MHAFKYADPPDSKDIDVVQQFFEHLNVRLSHHPYLMGQSISDCDIRVYPLVRQGAKINRDWFSALPFTALHRWMAYWDQEMVVRDIMKK